MKDLLIEVCVFMVALIVLLLVNYFSGFIGMVMIALSSIQTYLIIDKYRK
jgi:hypothetical protein